MSKTIRVEATVQKDIQTVWKLWTGPQHIQQWNHASDDWECPKAENDLRVGGHFSSIMSAKDKSESFDFNGTYTAVEMNQLIEYTIEGGRKVSVSFNPELNATHIVTTFEMEDINPEEMQKDGWQAILTNFKAYAESSVL